MLQHTLLVIRINGIHLFSPNSKGHRKNVVTTQEGGEKYLALLYNGMTLYKSFHCQMILEAIVFVSCESC